VEQSGDLSWALEASAGLKIVIKALKGRIRSSRLKIGMTKR